jgi:hypothetical protein
MANDFQEMWCNCIKRYVEHRYVGVQKFGEMVMAVYECPMCTALTRIPAETMPAAGRPYTLHRARVIPVQRHPHR